MVEKVNLDTTSSKEGTPVKGPERISSVILDSGKATIQTPLYLKNGDLGDEKGNAVGTQVVESGKQNASEKSVGSISISQDTSTELPEALIQPRVIVNNDSVTRLDAAPDFSDSYQRILQEDAHSFLKEELESSLDVLSHGLTQIYADFSGNYQSSAVNYYPAVIYSYSGTYGSAFIYVPPSSEENLRPTALEVQASTDENTESDTLSFLGSDADSSALSYSIVAQPSLGIVSVSGSQFTYDPSNAFHHLDQGSEEVVTFTYRAFDGSQYSDVASVILTITGVNDTPFAYNVAGSTSEDALSNAITFSSSDIDQNATLTYSLVSGPEEGSVSILGDTFIYNPGTSFHNLAAGESNEFNFTYHAFDGSTYSNPANISMTVTGLNDAPLWTASSVNLDPISENVVASTVIGSSVSSLLNTAFSDVDNASSMLGIAITANTANVGTQGSWQYSTNSGSSWNDVGTVSDSSALLLNASTFIRFNPVADYDGTPPELSVRAIDNTYLGSFEIYSDVSSHGEATAFSESTASIQTSVLSAPTLTIHNDYIALPTSYGATTIATITNAYLQATDADVDASSIFYHITNQSGGSLYHNGVALSVGQTFTQADIDSGQLTFQSNETNTVGTYSFTLSETGEQTTEEHTGYVLLGVTTNEDVVSSTDHQLSLREAITLANNSNTDSTILLASDTTYKLTLVDVGNDESVKGIDNSVGDLDISNIYGKSITLQGVGSDTVIDAGNSTAFVASSPVSNTHTLTVTVVDKTSASPYWSLDGSTLQQEGKAGSYTVELHNGTGSASTASVTLNITTESPSLEAAFWEAVAAADLSNPNVSFNTSTHVLTFTSAGAFDIPFTPEQNGRLDSQDFSVSLTSPSLYSVKTSGSTVNTTVVDDSDLSGIIWGLSADSTITEAGSGKYTLQLENAHLNPGETASIQLSLTSIQNSIIGSGSLKLATQINDAIAEGGYTGITASGTGNTVTLTFDSTASSTFNFTLDTATHSKSGVDNTFKLNLSNPTYSNPDALDDRVLQIDSGQHVTLSDLAIVGGKTAGQGGGILSASSSTSLNLDDVVIAHNQATGSSSSSGGGGLYTASNNTMTDLTVIDNTTNYRGGGIYASGGEITDASVYGNYAANHGGGIYAINSADISDSTVGYNYSAGTGGGGIYLSDTGSTLFNSTLIGNYTSASGAGVYATSSAQVYNVTIMGNTATGTSSQGAGAYISSKADLSNATIVENVATGSSSQGGGVYATSSTSSVNSSIIVGNTANAASSNLVLKSSATSSNDLTNDAQISSIFGSTGPQLSDNGGSTMTIAILGGSPAVNAGLSSPLSQDQRGANYSGSSDIGAYEYGVVVPPIVFDLTGNGIQLISSGDSKVSWDLFHNGELVSMAWVSPDDGLLVYDVNQDNQVLDANEFMLTSFVEGATTDLQALQMGFDSNKDGLFNSYDENFSSFRVWQDMDSDGVVDDGEFQSLAERGILSLDLNAHNDVHINNGSVVFATGTYETVTGTFQYGDVGLAIHTSQTPSAANDSAYIQESGIFADTVNAEGALQLILHVDDPSYANLSVISEDSASNDLSLLAAIEDISIPGLGGDPNVIPPPLPVSGMVYSAEPSADTSVNPADLNLNIT